MKIVRILFSVLLGIYLTYFCLEWTAMTPVISSAFVGLISSIAYHKKTPVPNNVGAAMYCGSFVGMGSYLSVWELLPAGVLATILILISTKIFKGYGGKLGFTAYVSSIITGLGIAIYNNVFDMSDVFSGFAPILDSISILYICVASTLGFYSTTYINHNLNKSAVLASALPSFVIGLLAFANAELSLFIATFFSASFAGMLSESLVSKKKHFWIVVALIIITILLKTGLGTFGGSLGTMAFLSVALVVFSNKK